MFGGNMKLTQYDICESCRDLVMGTGDTIGEYIEECMKSRGGRFISTFEIIEACEIIEVQLENLGGCQKCISKMKNMANI